MKLKLVVGVIILICGVFYGVRVVAVNNDPSITRYNFITYKLGETVEFLDNYTSSVNDISDGYTIQVENSWIESIDEFSENYANEDYSADEIKIMMNCDNIYMIKANFFNTHEEIVPGVGIIISSMYLIGDNYTEFYSRDAYKLINDLENSTFALNKSEEPYEVIIPYRLNEINLPLDHVKKYPPKLMITTHPETKLLEIQ